MPRLRYRIPQPGERVRIIDGDEYGRVGEVDRYDHDRSVLFVDLDAVARPWAPGFLLGTHPLAVEGFASQGQNEEGATDGR